MNDNLQPMKIMGANVISWFSTIVSLQMAANVLHIMTLMGSVIVSGASFWWIMKQAKNLDKKNKSEEGH
jgi:hypothetical protein